MKKQAIIFDLDGTIIDTGWIWKKVTRDLIESRGIPCDKQLANELEGQLCGLELNAACRIVKETLGMSDSVQTLANEKKRRARTLYKKKLTFVPGFTTFHQQVIRHGLKTGVATNSDASSLEAAKHQLNLETFFGNHIYSIADVDFRFKPDPAVYLHAAQQLGIAPDQCIAIEDSKHGVCAAQNAGMFCIGIDTGDMPELIMHADFIVNGYDQINLENLLER